MRYSSRVFVYVPVGLLLLLALLYSVYWRVQADTLAARLDRANGGEILPGVAFAFAEKSIGGYPFRLDTVLSGVTFAHRGPEGETAWRSESLAIHALSYGPPHYVLEASGLQSFARPPLVQGDVPRVIYVTPAVARASAIFSEGKLARFDLDVWEPQGKNATQGADPNLTFSAARAQFHALRRPNNVLDIVMKIEGGKLGEAYKPALGTELPLVDLRGKLLQSTLLDAFEGGTESFSDAVEKWRTAGGTLAVDSLMLAWGRMKTDMKGLIGLDAEHRLSGALLGTFDPSAVLSSFFMKGNFAATPMGQVTLSLQFTNGDIKAGASAASAPR